MSEPGATETLARPNVADQSLEARREHLRKRFGRWMMIGSVGGIVGLAGLALPVSAPIGATLVGVGLATMGAGIIGELREGFRLRKLNK